MTTSEAEVLYYLDRVRPMMHEHCDESFVDLGQSIHRCRLSVSDTVPCITPSSRLWKRRAREWLLAPEAMLAQGYDPAYVPCLTNFSHRHILNLMGERVQFQRVPRRFGYSPRHRRGGHAADAFQWRRCPPEPQRGTELGSALEDGRDDVEADLVRLLKEDRVLVSESEEESSD